MTEKKMENNIIEYDYFKEKRREKIMGKMSKFEKIILFLDGALEQKTAGCENIKLTTIIKEGQTIFNKQTDDVKTALTLLSIVNAKWSKSHIYHLTYSGVGVNVFNWVCYYNNITPKKLIKLAPDDLMSKVHKAKKEAFNIIKRID